MKTGAQQIDSLRDGRVVYLDGQPVPDVTRSDAFAGLVATSASFYDEAARPEWHETLSFESPSSGRRVSRAWQLPVNHAELVLRRRAMERIAELSCGMVGRSPDHLASTLAGMVMGAPHMARFDGRGTAALQDYFRYARDRDLYLTYVIINPQADRSKTAGDQPSRDLVAHIVEQDAAGLVVQGAKMLATSSMVAQELFIGNIQPLGKDDGRYAFSAAIPMNTPGLRFLSRRSYEQAAVSRFDQPLASRFDENDAVVYFDQVRIPWERVFLARDVAAVAAQWHETRAHVMQNHQCLVRLYVKLRFLVGIARKVAQANGIIGFPAVRETLGALAAKATMIEAMVAGMEACGEHFEGCYVPDRAMLCAAQAVAQQTYPQVIDAIRQLCGGGLIMLPSSQADLIEPATLEIVMNSQMSPAMGSLDRVKLFKLAWDAVGSEFGSRHLQYEMFYSGSSMVLNGHNDRWFNWGRAVGMVDAFMAGYATPTPAARAAVGLPAVTDADTDAGSAPSPSPSAAPTAAAPAGPAPQGLSARGRSRGPRRSARSGRGTACT